MVISPDGRRLAMIYSSSPPFRRPTQLMELPTTGGELRQMYRVPEGEHLRPGVLAWTPQGDLIFATEKPENAVGDPMNEFWRIRPDGGERESLGLTVIETDKVSVHPDGTWIALELDDEVEEVWAMENLLSNLQAPAGR